VKQLASAAWGNHAQRLTRQRKPLADVAVAAAPPPLEFARLHAGGTSTVSDVPGVSCAALKVSKCCWAGATGAGVSHSPWTKV
jgi:hypothetical protein